MNKSYLFTVIFSILVGTAFYLYSGLATGASFGLMLGVAVHQGYLLTKTYREAEKSTLATSSYVFTLLTYCGLLLWTGNQFLDRHNENQPLKLTPATFFSLEGIEQSGPVSDQLRAWMEAQIREDAYPSLGIAIANENGLVFEHVAGEAARPEKENQLLFPVASVSKSLTGTLLLRLHQEGLIDFDAPISKYLPEGTQISAPGIADKITPFLLATHTSGLPRSARKTYNAEDGSYKSFQPNLLYEALVDIEMQFDPGADRKYSNLGFGLLGHILERVSGLSYEQLLQTRIFDPAGMKDSRLLDYNDPKFLSRLVTPRLLGAGSKEVARTKLRKRMAASGGLATTAADLARFGSTLIRPDSPILDEKHQVMLTNDNDASKTKPKEESAFGRVREWEGIGRVVRKNGGRQGADGFIVICPERKMVVAVVANRGVGQKGGSTDDIAKKILGWAVTDKKD